VRGVGPGSPAIEPDDPNEQELRPGPAWLTGQRADGEGERPGPAWLTGQGADGVGERRWPGRGPS